MDSSIFESDKKLCSKQGSQSKIKPEWQTVQILMRRLIMNRLIRIYTVCKDLFWSAGLKGLKIVSCKSLAKQSKLIVLIRYLLQKVCFFSDQVDAKILSKGVLGGDPEATITTYQYTTSSDLTWQVTATVQETGILYELFLYTCSLSLGRFISNIWFVSNIIIC